MNKFTNKSLLLIALAFFLLILSEMRVDASPERYEDESEEILVKEIVMIILHLISTER